MIRIKKKFREQITESRKEFIQHIEDCGGTALFIKALAGQILWLALCYNITNILFASANGRFIKSAVIWVIVTIVWEKLIKSHFPKLLNDIVSGKIAFNLDNSELNIYVALMLGLNTVIVCPAVIKKFTKIYEKN
jgi:hypothetical protein